MHTMVEFIFQEVKSLAFKYAKVNGIQVFFFSPEEKIRLDTPGLWCL